MVFLQERLNDPRPARVMRMARALRTSRPGPARGGREPQATEKIVKFTAGWGGSRHVLFQACGEGSEKHCWGSMRVGRALTCFAPEPQACRQGSEKHCWGIGGAGSQWGVDRFIYVFLH